MKSTDSFPFVGSSKLYQSVLLGEIFSNFPYKCLLKIQHSGINQLYISAYSP